MSSTKLKKGADYGGSNFKVHLDGYDQTALFTGKSDKSARKFVFYYDETVLTAIRYESVQDHASPSRKAATGMTRWSASAGR